MANRQLASVLARYERDRSAFAWAMADAAREAGNAAPLAALGAPALLQALLSDPADSVAHTAAIALGRLAGHSSAIASALVQTGVVGTLIARMKQEPSAGQEAAADSEGGNPHAAADRRWATKRAAMGCLVSLSRHSAQLAGTVVQRGGMEAAIACLGEADAEVREGAAWALAHIVAHNRELASAACSAGVLPPLVACLAPLTASPAPASGTVQAADAAIKRVAASALGDISHSPDLAAQVVAAGAVGAIAVLLRQPLSNDARLKRQLLCALLHIARADAGLAQAVVNAGTVPDVARCLKFADDTTRRHAAACLREIVRHSPALAAAVVEAPGEALNCLAAYAASASSTQALPAITALGFAAEQSPALASQVAAAPGALAALDAALQSGDEHSKAAAAWALGRIGGQGPELAAQLSASCVQLCSLAVTAPEGSALQGKCLRAASAIVGQTTDVAQMASLLMQPGMVPALQELLLERCATVMAKQPASRVAFASSGVLAHLESLQGQLPADSAANQNISACLRLFPEELLHHYSPLYAAKLLASLSMDTPPADAIAAARSPAAPEQQDVDGSHASTGAAEAMEHAGGQEAADAAGKGQSKGPEAAADVEQRADQELQVPEPAVVCKGEAEEGAAAELAEAAETTAAEEAQPVQAAASEMPEAAAPAAEEAQPATAATAEAPKPAEAAAAKEAQPAAAADAEALEPAGTAAEAEPAELAGEQAAKGAEQAAEAGAGATPEKEAAAEEVEASPAAEAAGEEPAQELPEEEQTEQKQEMLETEQVAVAPAPPVEEPAAEQPAEPAAATEQPTESAAAEQLTGPAAAVDPEVAAD